MTASNLDIASPGDVVDELGDESSIGSDDLVDPGSASRAALLCACNRAATHVLLSLDGGRVGSPAVEALCADHLPREAGNGSSLALPVDPAGHDVMGVLTDASVVSDGPSVDLVLAAAVARALPIAALFTNARGDALFANSTWTDLTGQRVDAASGRGWMGLVAAEDQPGLSRLLNPAQRQRTRDIALSVRLVPRGQPPRWAQLRGRPLLDADECPVGWVLSLADVTDLKKSEEQLAHRALHDPLTGALNRAALFQHLERVLARNKRLESNVGVLFIDLDSFKAVNDRLGHHRGDQVLTSLAERLRSSVRPGDIVARYGGDEFILVCEDLKAPEQAISIAERVLDNLSEPIRIGRLTLRLAASVGIAIARPEVDDADGLVSRADQAMYIAKHHGNTYAVAPPHPPRSHDHIELDLRDRLPGVSSS
jgi:diguanylate cyclase (GGDEF)-like protein/PAS domain S-box-containing protein